MPKQLHILLADDDKGDRSVFKKALKELPASIRLTTIQDGEQLINFLSENTAKLPDLLFLDLNMSRKNGNECLSEIKRNEKLKQIPIIIYSTALKDDVADVLYQNGAHYCLKKSNPSDLHRSLNKVLRLLSKNPRQPPRNRFVVNLKEP